MRSAFDDVLARAPFFPHAGEMVLGYLEYGKRNADDQPEEALTALRRAERLSQGERNHDQIESLLLTLEAERLARSGVVDKNLLKRALELDPGNQRARERQNELRLPPSSGGEKRRYYVAAAVGLAGVLGVLAVLLRPRGKREKTPGADAGAPPAS
jgi:hypothetical protein